MLWLLGTLAAFALGEVVIDGGLLDRVINELNIVTALLVGDAISGVVYGGVTGVVLLALVWRSPKEPAPAVR